MKKQLLFAGLLIAMLSVARAQTTGSLPAPEAGCDSACITTVSRDALGLDSLQRLDVVDSDLVALRRAAGGDDVILEVAGFGITLARPTHSPSPKPRPRVNMQVFNGIELGFNTLSGLDYADYAAGTADFLDVRTGNSFHFSATLVGLSVELGQKRKFELSTGMRYTVDNYRLADRAITLGRENGMVVPVPLDERADKSKLRITSLGIPVQLAFNPVRHLRIAVTGYCDFALGTNAIYKKPKVKESLSGVNAFQFGVGGSVSYRWFGVYVRYGVTPLFKSHVGPTCHPVSFGVCIFM